VIDRVFAGIPRTIALVGPAAATDLVS
jgi:hypothetical protein